MAKLERGRRKIFRERRVNGEVTVDKLLTYFDKTILEPIVKVVVVK